jgi:hypothetical protein
LQLKGKIFAVFDHILGKLLKGGKEDGETNKRKILELKRLAPKMQRIWKKDSSST